MSYLGRSAKLSLKAQEKVSFLATAGQTVKTGLSYTPSFIEVYVNGVLLTDTTDFTATNGNSITFTVALLLNDEVTVISLKTFTVADHYTKTEADTLLAAKAKLTKSATAPSSPAAGDMWFDTTSGINAMKVYNGTTWKKMSEFPFSATGGTITTSGAYTIHTFTSSGTFTPNSTGSVDYLVVAGGGSGGAYSPSDAYTRGSNGSNSVFTSITAIGGGAGAAWDLGAGSAGGSGGGAAAGNNNDDRVGGAGTSGQGNAGGTGGNFGGNNLRGGGGGGAGAVGGNASSNQNGAGGAGLANSYSGSSVMYAGGGGGGSWQHSGAAGAGGSGGGGAGGVNAAGTAGTANTGGGGGAGDDGSGAGHGGGGAGGMLTGTWLIVHQVANTVTIGGGGASTNVNSGAGGSGIVIVRYLT
jgi:hypothetical protein